MDGACLLQQLKSRTPELEFLTHTITILAAHGWQQSESPSFAYAALDSICQRSCVPLEKANIDLSLVQEEWDDMLEYTYSK